MTPNELAQVIAEDVFRTIEREKTINKRQIAETIEKALLSNPVPSNAPTPGHHQFCGMPTGQTFTILDRPWLCVND